MAIAWSCLMPLATYAKLARQAPAPRGRCPKCATQMAFDGGYFRQVREAGTVHRVFIHRARCASCGCGHALLPDFILRRRLDSTRAVGAAVLVGVGVTVPPAAEELLRGVPGRTVRSWRQRFATHGDAWSLRFEALCLAWRGELPFPPPRHLDSTSRALAGIGLVWKAARRHHEDLPAPWLLANVITGNSLLSIRVDLPWPIVFQSIGHSRGP